MSNRDSILVENITKTYSKHVVLKDINANFESCKVHGIVGENGSGKSVLFKIICGLIPPDSGRVIINGKTININNHHTFSIGMIINSPGFLPNYGGLQNLSFFAKIKKRVGKDKIIHTMKAVGLEPELRKSVGKYSLGMKQRLGIAQAIMENPKIIILDEPFNGLDKKGVEEIKKIIIKLKQNDTTIFLASHNESDIQELCDDVYEMDGGKLNKL